MAKIQAHERGINTIKWHPLKDNLLLTGGDDESVRIFGTDDVNISIQEINEEDIPIINVPSLLS